MVSPSFVGFIAIFMLPVKYFCFLRSSFLCQLNSMEIIKVSTSLEESCQHLFR